MSQFRGVTWDKKANKWMAQITIEGKKKILGRFEDEHEAAMAYINASKIKSAMPKKSVAIETTEASTSTILSMSDFHIPYHDPRAVKAAFNFAEEVQPSIIVTHEVMDCYGLSKFDKNPIRLEGLQKEIDMSYDCMADLSERCPDSRIILLASNHLDRLQRYLWSKAPELSNLTSLEIPQLLGLDALNVEYMQDFEYKGVLYKHGSIVSQGAGATALREMQKEGMSGVSGHTHRLAQVYRRDRSGEYMWIEDGCLADLNPEYVPGVANWQQGVALVYYCGDNYVARALPIIGGKVSVYGSF